MDASRLFVKKENTFSLSAYYTKDGKMEVRRGDAIAESEMDNWSKMVITFSYPDFGISKAIMRNSMDQDANGAFSDGSFRNNLLTYLAQEWNLTEKDPESDEEKGIPLNLEKLNELRPDITRLYVELLQEKLIEEGLYQSLLLS
jgi:hypothetical protein